MVAAMDTTVNLSSSKKGRWYELFFSKIDPHEMILSAYHRYVAAICRSFFLILVGYAY